MNEIIEKTYELIDALNDSKLISSLEYYQNILLNDKKILEQINNYKITNDIDIKQELYKNDNYQQYMKQYNELFYLVMDINYKIKSVTNCKECHESN